MKIVYIDCYYGFNSSMLLSALVDAGASMEEIIKTARQSMSDFDMQITETKANSMDCKMVCTFGEQSAERNASELGALSAIEAVGAEYVMCSSVYLGDSADGEVISLLEKSGIEALPSSDINCSLRLSDASFLVHLCAESGPLPDMDIISVGYGTCEGAGDGLVTVYIGEYNGQNNLFAKEEHLITV